MNVFPLKFIRTGDERLLFADDTGTFFTSDEAFLERYANGRLTSADEEFLVANGHAFYSPQDLAFQAFGYRWAERQFIPADLDYVILVPSLRCNLSCAYCQVSRVGEKTSGFDWNEETLEAVLGFLGTLSSKTIKVEFQGGDVLLLVPGKSFAHRLVRADSQHNTFLGD